MRIWAQVVYLEGDPRKGKEGRREGKTANEVSALRLVPIVADRGPTPQRSLWEAVKSVPSLRPRQWWEPRAFIHQLPSVEGCPGGVNATELLGCTCPWAEGPHLTSEKPRQAPEVCPAMCMVAAAHHGWLRWHQLGPREPQRLFSFYRCLIKSLMFAFF